MILGLMLAGIAAIAQNPEPTTDHGWVLMCAADQEGVETIAEARKVFAVDGLRYTIHFSFKKEGDNYTDFFNLYSSNQNDAGRHAIVGRQNLRGPGAVFIETNLNDNNPDNDFIVASIDLDTYVVRAGGYVALAVQQPTEGLTWLDRDVLAGLGDLENAYADACQ